ncbi:MAG: hypothetical protein AABZ31_06335 [Bdellovibrionota bacterium]
MKLIKLSLVIVLWVTSFWASAGLADPNLIPLDYDLTKTSGATRAGVPLLCVTCNETTSLTSSVVEMGSNISSPRLNKNIKPVGEMTEVYRDSRGRVQKRTMYAYTESETQFMGMSQKQALLMARDQYQVSTCSAGHDQGDMANRWCHGNFSRGVSKFFEDKGMNPALSTLMGGLFWLPKEKLQDLNPSSHDLAATYSTSFGTKRSKFELTIFGDAIFDKHIEKVKPFSGSTPFLSFTRKLGPASKD